MANETNGNFPELSLEEIMAAGKKGDEIATEADQIRRWVALQLPVIDQAKSLSWEKFWLLAEKVQAIEAKLNEVLNDEDPLRRKAALLPFLKHQFSKEFVNYQAVDDLFNGLVKSGYLQENPWGDELKSLTVYNRTFVVSLPQSLMTEADYSELQDAIDLLRQRVDRNVKEAQREKANSLRCAGGNPNLDQLLAGKPGRYLIDVPPDPPTNGRDYWLGGGSLLVESDGQKIKPVEAAGSIAAAVEEAKKLNVYLLLYTLSPAWTKTKAPVINGLDENKGRKVQLLWYLLKRGIRAWEKQKLVEAERQEMAKKADLLPKQFFLEKKTGTCMVEFDGVWRNPSTPPIHNLFLLVCRKKEGSGTAIQIVQLPSHLKEFFANCNGTEYPEEDERFNGCAQPLKAVLQAVYGQTAHR
jgi:hypothetical protein